MKSHDILLFFNGKIKLEITTKEPEKILNIFSKKNIKVSNVTRENLYTIVLLTQYEYFLEIEKICEENNSKVVILKMNKIYKIIKNYEKYLIPMSGIILSFSVIFILSLFIWKIDIKGDQHVSPYEIRQVIKQLGIKKGTFKPRIDVEEIEDQIILKNKNVLWSKVRIQGSTLQVEIVESFRPPVIEIDNSLGDIVASKDGEIVRIYTQSGTAVVKQGDIVKKGDILIKGYQGKEGSTYEVPPVGNIVAKTFLEFEEVIELEGTKNVNTKNKYNEYYIELFGKKLFFKKYNNEFKDFEKVKYDGKFIKKNIYYEVDKSLYKLDSENIKKNTVDYYTKAINQNLKETDSIVGVLVKDEIVDNKLNIKISFVIEEDIGFKVKRESEIEQNIEDGV